MADADPQVATDQKKGWSSYCRAGNFTTCSNLRARCANPRHGKRGATPPPAPRPNPIKVSPSAGVAPSPRRKSVTTAEPIMDFAWEELPPTRVGPRPLDMVLAEAGTLKVLRAHPSQWARVMRYESKQGAGGAASKLKKALGDEFEWAARRAPEEASLLYGRFVGETSA